MHFHIITLFPESIEPYLSSSIVGRSVSSQKIKVSYYNPRDFTKDKHKKVDAPPFGGGPGMVLQAEPILRAFKKAKGRKKDVLTVFFSPRGREFNETYAKSSAKKYKHAIFICGHYEGIDERVVDIIQPDVVSVGPYTLTGGELPALIMIDAISRKIPGVLGNFSSLEEERTAGAKTYTRPQTILWKGKKYNVPKVLLSGNHKEIEEFRKQK